LAIHFGEGKLAGAPEMAVEEAVSGWNGDCDVCLIF
jgi:hypothetical protein